MGTRKPKAAADSAPDVDTKTLDLLADVAPANDPTSQAGGEIAPAASSEVGALALVTLEPAKYVAAIYQPFRAKFEQLRAEADVIVFAEADRAQVEHEQAELPEDQRRAVVVIDITTKDGMATAIKYRAGFRDDVRISGEKARAGRKAPLLEIGRLLDSSYKALVDESTPYEKYFDAAIEAETKRKAAEKAEEERLAAVRAAEIKAALDAITALPARLAAATSEELTAALTGLAGKDLTEAEFGDKLGDASVAVDTTAGALIALRDGALAREQAAAEALRLQAEEKQRLADQAEANRVEQERLEAERIEAARVSAETKRQLNEQAAQVAAARKAQELAAEQLAAQQKQQLQAMADIQSIQRSANIEGDARTLHNALQAMQAIEISDQAFGSMVSMAQMAKELAVSAIGYKYSVRLALELPGAHDEALDDNELFDAERAPQPAVAVMEHAPAIDWEVPATLPLPESCTEHDAMIDAGTISEGPDDMQIVDLVASEYGLTRSEAIVRLAQIDFKALEES